jgi:hypothetical protein
VAETKHLEQGRVAQALLIKALLVVVAAAVQMELAAEAEERVQLAQPRQVGAQDADE